MLVHRPREQILAWVAWPAYAQMMHRARFQTIVPKGTPLVSMQDFWTGARCAEHQCETHQVLEHTRTDAQRGSFLSWEMPSWQTDDFSGWLYRNLDEHRMSCNWLELYNVGTWSCFEIVCCFDHHVWSLRQCRRRIHGPEVALEDDLAIWVWNSKFMSFIQLNNSTLSV